MTTAIETVPTARELLDRAIALRPKLVERQAAAEERTHYDEEMHEEFKRAGFYRMFMPRRYGGFEVSVPTFMRVIVEIARGCPSTGWCLALGSNHALMVGSWFPQEAQDEVFAHGRFICASVAAPISEPAVKVEGGWELNGKVSFCSGIPYSTYYLGQALTQGEGDGMPGRCGCSSPRKGRGGCSTTGATSSASRARAPRASSSSTAGSPTTA